MVIQTTTWTAGEDHEIRAARVPSRCPGEGVRPEVTTAQVIEYGSGPPRYRRRKIQAETAALFGQKSRRIKTAGA